MYLLLGCSVIALTVILERLIFWLIEDRRRNQALVDEVLALCQRGEWGAARKQARGSKDFVVRILINGILHKEFSMAKAMESAAADELRRMRSHLGTLDTMITISPLLGILGTVVGIIVSFDVLGSSAIQDPQAVTGGIAQALITTASGLGIAILSVPLFNYLNTRAADAALTIEKYATSLEIVHERWRESSAAGDGAQR